jgi:hypothetical protein
MGGSRERETGEPGHDGGAVHEREAFLRRERERLVAEFGPDVPRFMQLAAKQHLAFAHQRRSDIGQRRQVAACAYRSLGRNAWQHPMVDQIRDALKQHRPYAG